MKNSKVFRPILLAPLACTMIAAVGCGDNGRQGGSKSTIVIEPFSGSGFGYTWIEDIAREFKQATGCEYNFKVIANSDKFADSHLDQIEGHQSKTDVFFGARPEYNRGFYLDYFEDLSDIANSDVDGNGLTIKDKIFDYETWEKVASKIVYDASTDSFSHEGFYMLPFSTTITGMIFDYNAFLDKGFLTLAPVNQQTRQELDEQGIVYHEGTYKGQQCYIFDSCTGTTHLVKDGPITIKGKDGKYGTYDDGQPQTIADFNTMVDKIIAKCGEKRAHIFANIGGYHDSILYAYLAQYAGLDNWDALVQFDSKGKEIELYDGTKTEINYTNGYKAYETKGLAEAVNFVYDSFYKNAALSTRTATVNDSQGNFIMGGFDDSHYYAMITEGNWFENEARETLNAAERQKSDRGYGKVDYRFIVLPDIPGQKGIDGNGHGTCFSGPEFGAVVVRKQEDADKLAAIKEFIKFTLTDENLAKVNAKNGMIRGYRYAMPEKYLSQLTPLQRTSYEIFQDEENVKILRQATDKLSSPFYYASSGILHSADIMSCKGSGGPSENFVLGKTGAEVINMLRTSYSETEWANMLAEVKIATAI